MQAILRLIEALLYSSLCLFCMQTSQTINSLHFSNQKLLVLVTPELVPRPSPFPLPFSTFAPATPPSNPLPKTRLSPAATAGHSAYLILSVNSFSHKSTQLPQCNQKCVLLVLASGLAHCPLLLPPTHSSRIQGLSHPVGLVPGLRSCFLIRWCQCPANAFGINACIQSVPPTPCHIPLYMYIDIYISIYMWCTCHPARSPQRLEMAVAATQFVLWHTECSLSLLYPREVPKHDMGSTLQGSIMGTWWVCQHSSQGVSSLIRT